MDVCVATDLSPAAAPAVALAIDWARRLKTGVLLLHVVHDPVLAPAFTSDALGDVARAKTRLAELAATSGVPCRVQVLAADDVAQAIVDASASCKYVFVGSHGKSGFQRLRLGSVAAAVLRRSRVPVVCLPAVAGSVS